MLLLSTPTLNLLTITTTGGNTGDGPRDMETHSELVVVKAPRKFLEIF